VITNCKLLTEGFDEPRVADARSRSQVRRPFVRDSVPDAVTLLHRSAVWREGQPTPKQAAMLMRFGFLHQRV
jgi:hypothetical protein